MTVITPAITQGITFFQNLFFFLQHLSLPPYSQLSLLHLSLQQCLWLPLWHLTLQQWLSTQFWLFSSPLDEINVGVLLPNANVSVN